MDANDIALLKNTDLFKEVADQDLNFLLDGRCSLQHFGRDTIIYLQNERCDSLDVILKGAVTVQKIDIEGKVLPISDFHAGQTLGENLMFSRNSYYPMTITAIDDTTLLHLRREDILSLCQRSRTFLENLLASLSGKTMILSEKLKSSVKTIRQILIDYLLIEHHAQKSTAIQLHLTKKQLAEKIGIQRSSLSRELNKMRRDGLIEFDARFITIRDPQHLRELQSPRSSS